MTARMLLDAIERDALPGMPLGERLIHLEVCHLADRKGVVRLSQSELAGKLGVTRQAVTKHTDALVAKRLLVRQGHGRYRVFVEPWSVESIARRYVDSLAPWAIYDVRQLGMLVYGDPNDLEWDGADDPRVRELDTVEFRLQAGGLLTMDDEGAMRKPRTASKR